MNRFQQIPNSFLLLFVTATSTMAADNVASSWAGFRNDGTAKVVQRGREFAVVATNELWDSKNPPKPETYREASRSDGHGHGHGHGTHGGGGSSESVSAKSSGKREGHRREIPLSTEWRPFREQSWFARARDCIASPAIVRHWQRRFHHDASP